MSLDDEGYQPRTNKICFIPACTNTSVKKPGLKFFCIRKELTENWCQLVGRNCPKKKKLLCCEDHLNVKEDLQNYENYLAGARARLKLSATLKNIPTPRVAVDFGIVKLKSKKKSDNSSDTKYAGKHGRNHLMAKIASKPKIYLGLPKNYVWAIDLLAKESSCLPLDIIITLFKIKTNDTFIQMSDEFEIPRCTIRLLFEENVYMLATFLQNIVYLPSLYEIKKNLPLMLRMKYSKVQMIIDCFEIQIEKPSKAFRRAQTRSQNKSCNTVKYLIACTAVGFIAFISKGYGGRISDKAIACKSGLIDIVPPNAVIMAGRGFKEIECLLSTKNVKLLCPPSVRSYSKLTKEDVIKTNEISPLSANIERVIKKVQEFHMLKPHAVVNHKHLKYLDEIVTIACGLINLQNPVLNADWQIE
ncbi:hypothetical protein MSG28_010610 [Choristoneura fumiferana]|uniref:Uncharacterized protein n=1 Tax=Choristoneura fumiferana TaxID=7141 RepID=A0ACC0KN41_CHOFU|nr:hypothetical protein MSG28_010610 [Choristoneura fumiferana]